MTTKQTQSQTELKQHLQDQLKCLQSSADAYDAGSDWEAKRLAVSIRILLHDTKSCKSLLGQLGQKNIQFIDSSFPVIAGNSCAHSGLVMTSMSLSKEANYVAFLDEVPQGQMRSIDFDFWWTATIFIDVNGNTLSRKDIVLSIADQDGGAHVDSSLNKEYADLSRNNSLGRVFSDGKSSQPIKSPERVAVRQIAHELLKSIIPDYKKLPTYPQDGIIIAGPVLLQGAEATTQIAILKNRFKKVGRNEPCPCGSSRKYKRCCGSTR